MPSFTSIPVLPLIGIESFPCLAGVFHGQRIMSGYIRNELCHTLQVKLGSDSDSWGQSQSSRLLERVTGMLLMPTMIGSFNLLSKVRVEALGELTRAIDWTIFFKHERADSSPEPYVIQVDIQDNGIAI